MVTLLVSKHTLISDVLLWTTTHGYVGFSRLAKTSIHPLCVETGYGREDVLGVMDHRDGERGGEPRESVLSARLDDIYIYIYIHCHPQTDCFIISQLFSMTRLAGRFKLRSKPIELYARLCILPLSHLGDLSQHGNYNPFCISFRLFTFGAIGFRSAQFVQRALHYVSGNR